MTFRIDPDAASLYKELKTIHRQLNSAMKGKPITHVLNCLNSVFGSYCTRYSTIDDNYNTQEEISWFCIVPTDDTGAFFNTLTKVHFDDDSNVTHLSMLDKWLYGALLPLSFKMDLHAGWITQLRYVAEILKQTPTEKLAYFNVWKEKTIIDSLGFAVDKSSDVENNVSTQTVSPNEALALCAAMNILQAEATRANALWPELAPWLNMMQTLYSAPDVSTDSYNIELWQEWAVVLKGVYLKRFNSLALDLPDVFSSAETMPLFTYT